VSVGHVLARELRDRVGPARLAHRADRRDLAFADVVRVPPEDLARREVEEALHRRQRRERGLERVVGADQVDAHRPDRALADRVDPRDRGAVDDMRRPAGELLHELRVEHVALVEREVRVLDELAPGERVAMEVVEREDLVAVYEPLSEVRRDKTRTARYGYQVLA